MTPVPQSHLTEKQWTLVLNSVHERAMCLLHLWSDANQNTFQSPTGHIPSRQELDKLRDGHFEHLEVAEILRTWKCDNSKP